jgi:hypothetical protein
MNKTLFLTAILSSVTANIVLAGTYEWTSGFTQGVNENMVDDGNGNDLNISCPDDEDQGVSAYATIAGKAYASTDGGFDVIVDGEQYSNPFYTDCNVCDQNFPSFWHALRSANKLQISAGGKTVNLPTKNLKQVLLPLDHKNNLCRSNW